MYLIELGGIPTLYAARTMPCNPKRQLSIAIHQEPDGNATRFQPSLHSCSLIFAFSVGLRCVGIAGNLQQIPSLHTPLASRGDDGEPGHDHAAGKDRVDNAGLEALGAGLGLDDNGAISDVGDGLSQRDRGRGRLDVADGWGGGEGAARSRLRHCEST